MKKTIIIFIAALALVTCKKQQVPGPEGPQGPQGLQGQQGGPVTGSIYGRVVINEYTSITTTTTIENCTVSVVDQTVQAITDAKGNYTLTNVEQGILDLSVVLPDGTKFMRQQYAFTGNGKALMSFSVVKKTTELVTGRFVDTLVQGVAGVYVFSNFDPSITKQRGLLLLIGSTDDVNAQDAKSYQAYFTRNSNGTSNKIAFFVSYMNLVYSTGFEVGQPIFITANPIPIAQYNYYYDLYSEQIYYYTAGAPIAPTFSTIVK